MAAIRKGPLAKLPIEALRRHLQVDALGGVIVRTAEAESLCRWVRVSGVTSRLLSDPRREFPTYLPPERSQARPASAPAG